MTEQLPKVTFGFVNCNRLFYLKSCVESFLICTEDYTNKEIIIVDNASVEAGTVEYLENLIDRGCKVIRQAHRDPANEYAKALNIIAEHSSGDFIAPCPGDIQFVVKGHWLREYVLFLQSHGSTVGCVTFDAQRRIRNNRGSYSNTLGKNEFKFLYHYNRNPIMGAMNCMVTKGMMDAIYPWDTNNGAHEGGDDSETKMLEKVARTILRKNKNLFYAAPTIPVSIGIYNETGDNARVRKAKRYGIYDPPSDGIRYYEIIDYNDLPRGWLARKSPIHIEEIAKSVGWKLPIDVAGNWIKNSATGNLTYEDLY